MRDRLLGFTRDKIRQRVDAYENIISLKREDRHFLMDKLIEVIDRAFDSWATRICCAYKDVNDGKLNVYLWEGRSPISFHSFTWSIKVQDCIRYLPVR